MSLRDPAVLEQRLNAFAPSTRRDALAALVALSERDLPETGTNVNLHVHSFFSYNAAGWSPSRIAWEARKAGWKAVALCDFDVLDGLDEFLAAGRTLGLRCAVHLETRAFLKSFAAFDINSPGEPGVAYIMGGGFVSVPAPGTPSAEGLASFRRGARARNEALLARINARLPELALDYEREVLPLTPAGVATERHIVAAYVGRAGAAFPAAKRRAGFWSPLLKLTPEACAELENDRAKFEERVRAALVKRGGIGYEQPSAASFPDVQSFVAWVRGCGAMPLITWLDGTSAGESRLEELVEEMVAMGCVGVNVIPERNWNIPAAAESKTKVANLDAFVRCAERRDLPVNIGTEMNRAGLPLVDDLAGPVLKRHRDTFLRGAHVMVGQSVLAAYADFSYVGECAAAELPDRKARNDFFAAVGALPPLTQEIADRLLDAGPERAHAMLRAAVVRNAP